MNQARKGANFELQICKLLSLWWSGGESDAIFCRSVTSGGFATTRRKAGKATKNAHGDITALDPAGLILLALFCFELKRGYTFCALDMIDKLPKAKATVLEKFWEQASTSSAESGAMFPAVIFKRNQKQTCIMVSIKTIQALYPYCGHFGHRCIEITHTGQDGLAILLLDDFLEHVSPEAVVQFIAEKRK